jgi:glutamyl-tRNA(Gln) amidotransferase subunit D
LSDKIVEHANEDAAAGITVMMGTDTLAYTSAALSFSLLGIGKPVVCVGAQRSSDRPSADSAINLKAAVSVAANFHRPGVYVAMHANENDDEVAIHRGTRVRKNHTSRRDAFKSIDIDCVALLRDGEIISESQDFEAVEQTLQDRVSNKTNFESSVSLLKFYPGFDPEILTFLSNGRKMKGIIIEATGLGHVSAKMIPRIAALTGDGIFVGITSQCIWGRVDLNVYDLGMDLLRANAVPLGNMLGETAFAKLAWVAGNFPRDSWSEIMLANLAGEHTSRTVL